MILDLVRRLKHAVVQGKNKKNRLKRVGTALLPNPV